MSQPENSKEYWWRVEERVESRGYIAEWGEYVTTGSSVSATMIYIEVLRHTPKGVRLQDGTWVSKTAKKRFAYPTQEEAIQGYAARKNRQVSILKSKLRLAEDALRLAESGNIRILVPGSLEIRQWNEQPQPQTQ